MYPIFYVSGSKTISVMVSGTRDLKYWVLGPSDRLFSRIRFPFWCLGSYSVAQKVYQIVYTVFPSVTERP